MCVYVCLCLCLCLEHEHETPVNESGGGTIGREGSDESGWIKEEVGAAGGRWGGRGGYGLPRGAALVVIEMGGGDFSPL
jgi:hypothetical protein